MEAVVDANVWLSATDPREPGHEQSASFLIEALNRRVVFLLPVLVLPEVAGTAARRTRNLADGVALAEQLLRLPDVRFFDLDMIRAQKSAQLASRLFLRGADSQYAALAAECGVPLITLDHELHERSAGLFVCLTPEEWVTRFA